MLDFFVDYILPAGYNTSALTSIIACQMSIRLEVHQLEGLDDRRRVFNRHVDLYRMGNGYVSNFYYEGQLYSSDPQPTMKEALGQLVGRLHPFGFKALRSRLNFERQRYLAEREPWVDYPDATQTG